MVRLAQLMEIPILDSVLDLYELVEERAKPARDTRLPIPLTLLKDQIRVSYKLFDDYDGKLCRVMLVLAWGGGSQSQ